jgi:hypothetical protein
LCEAGRAAWHDQLPSNIRSANGCEKRLNDDPAFIDGVLRDGAARARAIAAKNMAAVKDILGFVR